MNGRKKGIAFLELETRKEAKDREQGRGSDLDLAVDGVISSGMVLSLAFEFLFDLPRLWLQASTR